MKSYLLSHIDEDTWSLLKALCAYNKITVRAFFQEAINLAVAEFTRTDFYKDIVQIHVNKEVDEG